MASTKTRRPLLSDADAMLAMAPMPSRASFFAKLARSCVIASAAIGGGLLLGMLGYHTFGRIDWRESFYYASMILAGEGPPADPTGLSPAQIGRLHLFAGFYALFSGVTFITMIGVLFAPVVQRVLHRFHLELASGGDPR
jgi:hypothetical protein